MLRAEKLDRRATALRFRTGGRRYPTAKRPKPRAWPPHRTAQGSVASSGRVSKVNGSNSCYAGTSTPIEVGDYVAVEPLLSCGVCGPCKKGAGHVCEKLRLLGVETDGGFADYFVAPLYRLYQRPVSISLKEAALSEPLAVAVHSVNKGSPEPGDRAVILGAGPIGLLIGLVLKAKGIQFWISELDDNRIALAKKLGFGVIDAKKDDPVKMILDLTNGHGADMTFDAAGVPSVGPQLVPITAILGRIVLTALHKKPCEIFFRQLSYGEQSIHGVRIYARGDFGEGIKLMESESVNVLPLISHTFEMEDYEQAFATAKDSSNSCKVLIHIADSSSR
jgi:2-desacetyl-2-hydroxyethyl bacteriochlorophyllide A dehydrogenase